MNRRELLKTGMGLAAMSLPGVAKAHEAEVKDHELPEAMLPRLVRMGPGFAPGEIHVNPIEFALYWTLPGGDAMRYIVGVGRPGLYESGEFYVGAKKEWPSWTPTPGMIDREPEKYAKYKDGMPGGIDNPLGARALYLFTPERGDTFLRIHGTNDPDTLGRRVSNGCARLVNSQIIELYDPVPMGTRVVLYPFG